MGTKGKTMRRSKRHFTEEFKRQVVQEVMTGPDYGVHVAKRYGIHSSVVSKWCKRFEQEAAPEPEEDSRALKARVAELERMVGRLAMENDFLKKFAAYTKQQTSERSSIVTAKSLALRKPAGSLGLPAAATTTDVVRPASKTPGLKNV